MSAGLTLEIGLVHLAGVAIGSAHDRLQERAPWTQRRDGGHDAAGEWAGWIRTASDPGELRRWLNGYTARTARHPPRGPSSPRFTNLHARVFRKGLVDE